MIASFETVAGIIRTHPEGDYGAPYTWSCHAALHGDVAYLRAAMRAPTQDEAHAIKRLLAERGITEVRWERRNTARARETRIATRQEPPADDA